MLPPYPRISLPLPLLALAFVFPMLPVVAGLCDRGRTDLLCRVSGRSRPSSTALPRKPRVVRVRHIVANLVRVAIFAGICLVFTLAAGASLSKVWNLSVIVAATLLTFPVVWLGRKLLDRHATIAGAVWITTFVHVGVGLGFGVPIVRAVVTHEVWPGWVIPVPAAAGLALVIVTGFVALLTVTNLALRGFGAPFFIALSRKLAADWLYAWTRNPMALAALPFFLSLGIWLQSGVFVLWTLVLFVPAMLFFLKFYEERELEIRFGASYLVYKSRTPMLFPRRPSGRGVR